MRNIKRKKIKIALRGETKELQHKRVLSKFKRGAFITSEEEMEILQRHASTGMVTFGFNHDTNRAEAKLTRLGRWFVRQL
jgi:hypothetical protein